MDRRSRQNVLFTSRWFPLNYFAITVKADEHRGIYIREDLHDPHCHRLSSNACACHPEDKDFSKATLKL